MLQKLQIKNFQSHADSTIEFADGVTLITGTSNHGKTAILRSLNWIVTNRPLGDSFIRNGEDCCDVTLATDEGVVRRIRSDKQNIYILASPNIPAADVLVDKLGGLHTEFSAMGSSVPEEVTKVLNIQPINIQQQLDPYFLVLDSPGKIGSYFNSIIHLDEVEAVVDEISRRIRSETVTVKELKEDVEGILKDIAFYESLDLKGFEIKLNRYIILEQEIDEYVSEKAQLNSLLLDLSTIEKQLVEIPDVDVLLESAKDLPVDIVKLQDFTSYLKALLDDYDKLDIPLMRITTDEFAKVEEAETLVEYLTKTNDSQNMLFGYIEDMGKIEVDSRLLVDSIQDCSGSREELMNKVAVCPYCETDLDEEHRTILLEKERIDG